MRPSSIVRAALAFAIALPLLAGCGKSSPVAPPNPGIPLSAIVLTETTDTLTVGQNHTFIATAYDTLGVPTTKATLTWRSTNTSVCTVSNNGNAHAVGEGNALVIVSGGGRADSALVSVDVQGGWYAQPSGTTNDLNGVFVLSDARTGWAVGAAGTIVSTTDAGASWHAQASSTSFNLNAVWFTSSLEGWAVGNNGTVMHTLNAGVSWTRATVPASDNLMGVRFADTQHGWVVGGNGVILRTGDGGASWSKANPTVFQLESVSFSDTSNGWAVGGGGVIVGTHDGGRSWYVVQPSVTGAALKAVWRRSNTAAWAVGANGAYPFTTATADSFAWNLVSLGASNALEGVQMVTSLVGYAVGLNGVGLVLKTEDGGSNWTSQVSNSAQKLNDVYFVDTQRGWAVGQAGRIVHASRGGL